MDKPITFLVKFKDLCDRDKNPNLSLSVEAILKNEKIPKTFLSGGPLKMPKCYGKYGTGKIPCIMCTLEDSCYKKTEEDA